MKVLYFSAASLYLILAGGFCFAVDDAKPTLDRELGAERQASFKPTSDAAGTTVLYDFRSDSCGPCRSMDSTVSQLIAQGLPVRRVNVEQEHDLAVSYGVQAIPCFVMVVNGKEVDRVVGATDMSRLQLMFSRNGVGPAVNAARGQSPDSHRPRLDAPGFAVPQPKAIQFPNSDRAEDIVASQPQIDLPGTSAPQRPKWDRLIRSSVRLKIEDETGDSVGSGTIIDARAGEALIITCGHVFRDAAKDGRIWVDLFGSGAPHGIQGRLIDFDLKSEVGLISIHTDYPVIAAHLAPPGYAAHKGDAVISVGCDGGADATPRETQVTSINRYVGAANLQVAFQPVQGRSGGGLFTPEGYLVGVCYAADPEDHQGLFSALPALCDELDRAGLAFISSEPPGSKRYVAGGGEAADAGSRLSQREVGNGESGMGSGITQASGSDSKPFSRDPKGSAAAGLSAEEQMALAALREKTEDSEVICIVRPTGNTQGKSEIVVLDHVSPGFLERLAAERPTNSGRQLTSLEVPANAGVTKPTPAAGEFYQPILEVPGNGGATKPAPAAAKPSGNGPIQPSPYPTQTVPNSRQAQRISLEPWWSELIDTAK